MLFYPKFHFWYVLQRKFWLIDWIWRTNVDIFNKVNRQSSLNILPVCFITIKLLNLSKAKGTTYSSTYPSMQRVVCHFLSLANSFIQWLIYFTKYCIFIHYYDCMLLTSYQVRMLYILQVTSLAITSPAVTTWTAPDFYRKIDWTDIKGLKSYCVSNFHFKICSLFFLFILLSCNTSRSHFPLPSLLPLPTHLSSPTDPPLYLS